VSRPVTHLLPAPREADARDVVLQVEAEGGEVDGYRLALLAIRRGGGGVLGGETVDVGMPQPRRPAADGADSDVSVGLPTPRSRHHVAMGRSLNVGTSPPQPVQSTTLRP